MPARGYEFYLRAECSTRYLTSEKKRDLLSSHNDGDLFTCEGNMLFSLVKI